MQPPEVDANELKLIKAKGYSGFLEGPDETGLRWIRRKKDGSCWFLGKDNRCIIYSVRPAICRLEPFTIADYNYETRAIELELNFPSSCACEGVTEGAPVSKVEVAKAAQVVVRKVLELASRDLDLPITDERVACEARSRILRGRVLLANLQIDP